MGRKKLPEGERKANKKKYDQSPERKAKRKEIYNIPENKAKKQEYGREYYKKNKETILEKTKTPEAKTKRSTYNTSTRGKASTDGYRRRLKIEVLTTYSQKNNFDIPTCVCCGLDEHVDFLSMDHIDGKDGIVDKGKKARGHTLNRKLKAAGFPDGYQVLCYNCNAAAGFFGSCPHERKRKEETFAMMEEQSSFEAGF